MGFFSGMQKAISAGIEAYKVNNAEEYFKLQSQRGIDHSYRSNDYTPSLDKEKYKLLMDAGHIGAEYILTTNGSHKTVSPQNESKAIAIQKLVSKLRRSNDNDSKYYLANILLYDCFTTENKVRERNDAEARQLMEDLSASGYSDAINWMAGHYANLKQYDEAEKYYKRAVRLWNLHAMLDFADFYHMKLKNDELAKKWLIKAANGGLYFAKYRMAVEISRNQLSKKQLSLLENTDCYEIINECVDVFFFYAVIANVKLKRLQQESDDYFSLDDNKREMKKILSREKSWFIKDENEYDHLDYDDGLDDLAHHNMGWND
jgi:TPR repeat protein